MMCKIQETNPHGPCRRKQRMPGTTRSEHANTSVSHRLRDLTFSRSSQSWYSLATLWYQYLVTNYLQPQRCILYIKQNYPRERFETTFLSLWEWMYYKGIDISKPENMAELLRTHGYTLQEIESTLAAAKSREYKEALTANTQKALDQGAYGAPWFWVRNKEGKEEPFFGSDR